MIIYIFFYNNIEHLDNNQVPSKNLPSSPTGLPISPNLSSNSNLGQYSNAMFNDPLRTVVLRKDIKNKNILTPYGNLEGPKTNVNDQLQQNARLDVKENKSYSAQPNDLFFDIFNINCTQPFNRPWACLLMEGNNINTLPQENCRKVCPEKFEKVEEEWVPTIEPFKDFVDKEPTPSHFWCIAPCNKKCQSHKFDPLDVSKNNCGENGFSQVPLNVYLSEKECMNDLFPCDGLNEKECLLDSRCGYCTNNSGQGFCFRGTTEGPLNVTIPCVPDRVKPTNSYFKGNLNPFEGIKQSW